jgi:hypothetical protein
VVPHSAACAVDSGAASGCADVLAGKAARYHVNTASPRFSVKGSHVIPNRESRENAVILSGAQYSSGIGVPLNGANGAPAEEFAAEYSATSACE